MAYRNKPKDALMAYEFGASLGLSWTQSLRSVSVINGQAALWGDAVPALILGSGSCERFHETFTGKPFDDDYTAVCTMKRKGLQDEIVRTFSVADAKRAKLWMKVGRSGGDTPWVTYPQRMLQMRARGFAARDAFADKLSGLILAEEAMDYPDAIDVVPVSVETVAPSAVAFDRLPEALRDNIEKAFTALAMSPGARLTKLNEFLQREGDLEENALAMLEWCRDEYAKRKTGQPRAKGNGKSRENAPSPTAAGPSASPHAAAATPSPASGGGTPDPQPPTADEIFKQPEGPLGF